MYLVVILDCISKACSYENYFYLMTNVNFFLSLQENYSDVTLACDGKFYPVHKLVLSSCSEYFEQMFDQAQGKHPFIVLKDIRGEELECLLSYMYVGEVNVVQEKLSGLIKAAECLRIKGLAVPDEEPKRDKRSSDNNISSEPKRRRQDEGRQSSNRSEERRKSIDQQAPSNKFRNSSSSSINNNSDSSIRERSASPLTCQSKHSDVKEEENDTPEDIVSILLSNNYQSCFIILYHISILILSTPKVQN